VGQRKEKKFQRKKPTTFYKKTLDQRNVRLGKSVQGEKTASGGKEVTGGGKGTKKAPRYEKRNGATKRKKKVAGRDQSRRPVEEEKRAECAAKRKNHRGGLGNTEREKK